MEETEEQISMEIETLESIYIHELEIFDKNDKFVKTIKVNLKPATGEDESAQWVCMELWFYIPVGYPDTLPEIAIKNPRGLSDQRLQQIEKDLHENAQNNEGIMMLFQLIEVAKDHLTKDNLPACSCAICLYGFNENDVFVKTSCFHYFHTHCLSRYVKFQLDEIREKKEEAKRNNSPLKEPLKLVCPMCRLEIPEDIVSPSTCEDAPPPWAQKDDPEFAMTPEIELMRSKMNHLYLRQQERGGIIDVEEEKNKFFIQISNGTEDESERPRPQPIPETKINPQPTAARVTPKSRPEDSSDSDSDSGSRGCRGNRARKGRGSRMYPTPAEKKRAHLQALQQMKLNEQTRIQSHAEKSAESTSSMGASKAGSRGRVTAGGCASGVRKGS